MSVVAWWLFHDFFLDEADCNDYCKKHFKNKGKCWRVPTIRANPICWQCLCA